MGIWKRKNTFMIGGEQDRHEMNSLLKEGTTVEDHVVATEIRPSASRPVVKKPDYRKVRSH